MSFPIDAMAAATAAADAAGFLSPSESGYLSKFDVSFGETYAGMNGGFIVRLKQSLQFRLNRGRGRGRGKGEGERTRNGGAARAAVG